MLDHGSPPKTTVSIVVPVFNTPIEYISGCIHSILRQTYQNFEIIVVDDGSHGKIARFLDSLTQIDGRIRIIHQGNLGPAAARNAGIRNALGDYICFVDSDDLVSSDYIHSMYYPIAHGLAEMGCCKFRNFRSESELNQVLDPPACPPGYRLFTRDEALSEIIIVGSIGPSPCNKLYSREKLLSYQIQFPEDYRCAEDQIFNVMYFRHIQTVAQYATKRFKTNSPKYFYRLNPQSLTNTYGTTIISENRIACFRSLLEVQIPAVNKEHWTVRASYFASLYAASKDLLQTCKFNGISDNRIAEWQTCANAFRFYKLVDDANRIYRKLRIGLKGLHS